MECGIYLQRAGANLKFTIQNIHDPFRVFCILELSYSPQTDFRKLAYFLYYYMNDVEFLQSALRTAGTNNVDGGNTAHPADH